MSLARPDREPARTVHIVSRPPLTRSAHRPAPDCPRQLWFRLYGLALIQSGARCTCPSALHARRPQIFLKASWSIELAARCRLGMASPAFRRRPVKGLNRRVRLHFTSIGIRLLVVSRDVRRRHRAVLKKELNEGLGSVIVETARTAVNNTARWSFRHHLGRRLGASDRSEGRSSRRRPGT